MKRFRTYERAVELAQQNEQYCKPMQLTAIEEHGRLGRYLLRGHNGFSWAEVVVLRNGGLLVHGDVDTVVFGYCYPAHSARDVICWMAYAEYDYATEKASIGSSQKIAREWDRDVAIAYVIDWRRHRVIERETAHDLIYGLKRWTWEQHEFIEAMSDAGMDSEYFNAGEVTAASVFTAQAVLRRLDYWLEARDFQKKSRMWFGVAA